MKNFKKLIKEAYLGNPLNENLIAKFQDALNDDQFSFFQRSLDKAERGEELNQSEEQVVKYFGMVKAKYDDAIAQGMSPDEITLNPNKPIDETASDKGYDWLKNPSVKDQEYLRQKYESWNKMNPNDQIDIEKALKGINKDNESEMTPEKEHEHVKNLLKKNFMDISEARINEVIGIGRPTYRDKKNKIARERSANKTANYHDLLKYYQYAIAKIPRHKREKANNAQAMHDRYSQEVWDILKKSYPEANLS